MKKIIAVFLALCVASPVFAQSTLYSNSTTGNVGIGTNSPTVGAALDLGYNTNSMILPIGTTAQRPSTSVNGMIRYNKDTPNIEAYIGGSWTALTTGGTSASINLGSSTSTANPFVSGDLTTGFYTAGSHLVDVSANNTKITEWSSSGENIVTGSLLMNGANGLSYPTDISMTDGSVAIGSQALVSQPTIASTFTHTLALDPPTGIFGNTALGYQAIGTTGMTTSAYGNTAIGFQSGKSITSAHDNTLVGMQSGKNLTDGGGIGGNTLIGYQAGITGTALTYNTVVGFNALYSATSGSNNTVMGSDALRFDTIGSSNVVVGDRAGYYMTSGSLNVAIGRYALNGAYLSGAGTSGNYSTAVGSNALTNCQGTCSFNTSIGYQAGQNITTGNDNTILGSNVGSITTGTGSSNILIGVGTSGVSGGSDTPASGTNNYLNIGNLLEGDTTYSTAISQEALFLQSVNSSVNYLEISGAATGANPVLSAQGSDTNIGITITPQGTGNTIISSGNVGIGTATPSYTLHVNGSVAGTSAYVNLSDARHKKNVMPLQAGLKEVMQLKPVIFEWKDTPKDKGMKGQQIGFIAQDIEQILPSIVLTEDNAEKTKGMKYSEIIPVLTKAIQELKSDNDNLRTKLHDDEATIAAMRAKLGM